MKNSNPITIAIPGEKRNQKCVKEFLLSQWLISESDLNLDLFAMKWSRARIITLRLSDALPLLLEGKIAWVINGNDMITDSFLSKNYRLRSSDKSRAGYDLYTPYTWCYSTPPTPIPSRGISKPFSIDTFLPTQLKMLTREKDNYRSLESLSRRGDILTNYPYLVRMLLARMFGWWKVWKIQKVEWKIEAQLAMGLWVSAVDIVDTWETAKRNNLVVGQTLFESVPVWIFPDIQLAENVSLRWVVSTLIDASTNAYYDTSFLRKEFPGG